MIPAIPHISISIEPNRYLLVYSLILKLGINSHLQNLSPAKLLVGQAPALPAGRRQAGILDALEKSIGKRVVSSEKKNLSTIYFLLSTFYSLPDGCLAGLLASPPAICWAGKDIVWIQLRPFSYIEICNVDK